MRTLRNGKFITTALAAALLAGPALAISSGDWDSDSDGALNQEEFLQGFQHTGVFDTWDEDGDGALNEDEFTAGAYRAYDRDRSGDWSAEEYGQARGDWERGTFWGHDIENESDVQWDVDQDGTIKSKEFNEVFRTMGVHGEWDVDGDGALNRDEFARGVFNEYASEESGTVDQPDFARMDEDLGDEGFWNM